MGCFLACFGHSKKRRKHRKHSNRALIKDTLIRGSYEPLQSSVPLNLNITENPVGSDLEFRDKPKIQLRSKIRKKVSFNLNVQVYEPISTDYHLLENDTEEEHNKSIEESKTKKATSSAAFEGHNYRYQNWLDRYDEDDEIAYEDDDLHEKYSDDGGSDDEDHFSSSKTHSDSNDGKSESIVSDENISKYEHSVLCPIENLTQWKAVKARKKEPSKPQRKENIAVEKDLTINLSTISNAKKSMYSVESNVNRSQPKTSKIAVDASLCNWLARPCPNQVLSLDNKSENGVEAILCNKSSMDKTNLPRYREDSPNLDISDWET